MPDCSGRAAAAVIQVQTAAFATAIRVGCAQIVADAQE
jgi:hypothetical protein